jgi:hypothetical protein
MHSWLHALSLPSRGGLCIPYATVLHCQQPLARTAAYRLPPPCAPAVVLAVAGSREKLRLLEEAITLYGTYIRCMAVHVFKVGPGSSRPPQMGPVAGPGG